MEHAPHEAVRPETRTAGAGTARWIVAGVVALVVVALLAYRLGGGGKGEQAAVTPSPTPSVELTVTEVFERTGPSVVVIRAGPSLGTGVIAAEDGTIVTAYHVVKEAEDVTVTFSDGTKADAVVASSNPRADVATLRPARLPEIVVPATLGGAVAVGAPVVAIGNPLGLTYSVSTGVVSGLDRTVTKGDLSGLIQFDASVNPGSSGGPLLDARGSVIGIVVSIADPGGDEAFAGIAFAVPIGAALGDDGEGPGGGPQI
ncbi:S1C family serine protease [Sphaerisporangium rubeum]|uniref:S1-C subfamily serine protease n=1 Tax=Sphaerisporangium rubeum TaxID=321317 RepID=A0A7X0IIH1_9ACTN|nr:trypsin-like peptidase domain-containing protein [Sphaerisporangium rubeum]MBB6474282.1 S1-C subfamily serine protease [Sphaerisporangium rubeum]